MPDAFSLPQRGGGLLFFGHLQHNAENQLRVSVRIYKRLLELSMAFIQSPELAVSSSIAHQDELLQPTDVSDAKARNQRTRFNPPTWKMLIEGATSFEHK